MGKLHISSTPHIHQKGSSTHNIMRDVVIAMLPAAIAGVIIFGLNGGVNNDERVAKLIQTDAKNVGLDVPIGPISLGATDSAAASQAGFPASSFVAMDPTPARYYHTRLDTADNLSAQAIDTTVKLALEAVFLYDEQGI